MDGPVLSGGVIVLVAMLLWALYLMPTWRGRHQYNAAERNAVRLNQALRVLAETSETPDEVRLELNTRTAVAQQKLAKRVQAEKADAELERLRQELAATRRDPIIRQARARRRVRLTATMCVVAAAVMLGLGIWQFVATGGWMLGVAGLTLGIAALIVLARMASVAARAGRRVQPRAASEQAAPRISQTLGEQLDAQEKGRWTPRPLPQPMVAVAGSRAQVAQAQIDAQHERQRAIRLAELRRRAEELAPPAPTALPVQPAATSAYAQMGMVDDAEIEAHVRDLLARRAAV
ncbi:hypothetical protein [Microbacterium istanbulense]|uniref:Large exoprotein n=1 Tax=Microbacterium istanbulense TaxID=3122049 RepID=A0ABU8LM27_9MICO